ISINTGSPGIRCIFRQTMEQPGCRSTAGVLEAGFEPCVVWRGPLLTGVYRFPPMESVIYGRPFAEAVKEQVEQSGATAVFLLASGTLARETGLVGKIRDALGNRLAGLHAKIGAHTPRTDVVEAANAARGETAERPHHDDPDDLVGRRI